LPHSLVARAFPPFADCSRQKEFELQTRDPLPAKSFVDQNIACTRDRTGILIYVSTFEQRAEVVVDIGIIRRENDGQLARAIAKIENVIAQGGSIEAFEQAVREFGLWLADSLPPRIDDTNELADEVNVS
jgi:putative membrane protein